MGERRAKAILLAAGAWIVIAAVLAVAYRWLVRPATEARLVDQTGSEGRYREEIILAADAFSGYCLLRSEPLRDDLARSGVRLTVQDDNADYHARIRALRDGDVHLAVFTIDSLISASAALGEYPATIVLVIDETCGADAVVSRQQAVAQLSDLRGPEARMVLTPDSPSEFLARTVIANFDLPGLPSEWLEEAEGPADVLKRLQAAPREARKAYVLWEPYVTQALQQPGVHVLIDSSRLKGYIVDVLVAERSFLRDHPGRVRGLVEAYLRTAYAVGRDSERLVDMVRREAAASGAAGLDEGAARRLVTGIQWKNTLENYAHFGLLPAEQNSGLPHVEDMIRNITEVLVNTAALSQDAVADRAHTLYYDRILRDMQAERFHPGGAISVTDGAGSGAEAAEQVRGHAALAPLSDADWERLMPVGELRVAPISFARGMARMNVQSERELAALADRLQSWPSYYLTVSGHTRPEGDAEANRRLAMERAQAAADHLVGLGVARARIRARAMPLSAGGGDAQSVSFKVGQLPY